MNPIRRNLGDGGHEILSLFLAQYSEGSKAMERLFEDMGEPIDTLVGVLSFKTKNGVKGLFISPCVHPGPVGNIGGGNMPTLLANSFDTFTIVSNGPTTNDFNQSAPGRYVNKKGGRKPPWRYGIFPGGQPFYASRK